MEAADRLDDSDGPNCVGTQLAFRVHDSLSMITRVDLFHDITQALPLTLNVASDASTGVQEPYQKSAYDAAMRTHGTYTCGGNLFWCKFAFSPSPGVPTRMSAIDSLVAFYFAQPSPMPRPAVISVSDLGSDPLDQRGELRSISPEEIRCAMLFAIARDVARGAPPDVLNKWRCHALSTTMQFVYHATDEEMYSSACQLREDICQDHESMSRTPTQRIYEIACFREMHPAPTCPEAIGCMWRTLTPDLGWGVATKERLFHGVALAPWTTTSQLPGMTSRSKGFWAMQPMEARAMQTC